MEANALAPCPYRDENCAGMRWIAFLALSLYRVADGSRTANVDGAATAAVALAISADESMAATGSYSNQLTITHIKRREIIGGVHHEETVTGVAFSPDGKTVFSGDMEGVVRCFDVGSQKLLWQVSPGLGASARFVLSPDRRTILAFGAAEDMFLLNFAGKVLARFHGHKSIERQPAITGITFGPEGKTLVTAGVDQTVRVWDAATCKELYRLDSAPAEPVGMLAFAAHNRLLAVVTGTELRVWTWPEREPTSRFRMSGIRSFAFSPDGSTLALADAAGVHLYDPKTGRETALLAGTEKGPTRVLFSPDGRTLATIWLDFKLRLWDVPNAKH